MTDKDIEKELARIKYHIRIIGGAIDWDQYPIEHLIISMNWDEDQLNAAHDIFEKYNNKMAQNEEIEWSDFERELKGAFNVSYQTVKTIVLALYRNDQWVSVCRGYAKSFEPNVPVELQRITNDKS